jgi:Glycosyl hydrolases family 16
MPVGDLPGWTQTYAQDFNTPAALGKFASTYPGISTYDGQKDTSGHGLYSPAKVLSVSNSSLDFYLHSENGQPLVATVMPDGYKPHTYARVSIRYKADNIPGYKFVGMLWPVSDQWNEGEIDWPEGDLAGVVRPASAIPGTFSNGNMKFEVGPNSPTDQTGWHVATTEWVKGAVRFYWDGQLIATDKQAVPTTPFRATLQAETAIGEGATPTNSSGHLDIDWITIYNAS